jgi:hypothetical protein
MQQHLKDVLDNIMDGSLEQELLGRLKKHPVIHFSDHAEKIMTEGFLFGESVAHRLDYTLAFGNPKAHVGPGYNFAFNTVEWDIENDCLDYEVVGPKSPRDLNGMHADSAVLLNVDGIYTRHFDEFHQVIFWGADAQLAKAILLKNTGTIEIDDDVEACDDEGDPIQCWTATAADGTVLVERDEMLCLRECVLKSLIWLDQNKQLSSKVAAEYKSLYEDQIDDMGLAGVVAEIKPVKGARKVVESSSFDR